MEQTVKNYLEKNKDIFSKLFTEIYYNKDNPNIMYFKKLIAYAGYYDSEYKNKLLKFYEDLNDLNVKICSFENIDRHVLEIIENKICIYSSDKLIINDNNLESSNNFISEYNIERSTSKCIII